MAPISTTAGRSGRFGIRALGAALRRAFPVEPVPPVWGDLLERGAALAGAGAWECDLDTNLLTWTDGVFDLFGLPPGERIHREDAIILYDEQSRAEMER